MLMPGKAIQVKLVVVGLLVGGPSNYSGTPNSIEVELGCDSLESRTICGRVLINVQEGVWKLIVILLPPNSDPKRINLYP